jgi:hypothetical protein
MNTIIASNVAVNPAYIVMRHMLIQNLCEDVMAEIFSFCVLLMQQQIRKGQIMFHKLLENTQHVKSYHESKDFEDLALKIVGLRYYRVEDIWEIVPRHHYQERPYKTSQECSDILCDETKVKKVSFGCIFVNETNAVETFVKLKIC